MTQRMVIYTDLDGTLLDHASYSLDESRPALQLALARSIPIVFCSSKTRAEIEVIRQDAGVSGPFIVENGGAIYIPEHYFRFEIPGSHKREGYDVLEFGTAHADLVKVLQRLEAELGANLRGFHEMTVEQVASDCGLSLEEARRAKLREYDEPFAIENGRAEVENKLAKRIVQLGLNLTRGGRYLHLLGDNNKGRAVQNLTGLFRRDDQELITVGLGDSLNDLPMLKEVDLPFLVRKPDGRYDDELLRQLPRVHLAEGVGPAGWNAAVTDLLKRN